MPRTLPPVLPSDALARRQQPVLAADGLRLRPWTEHDAPAVQAAFSSPDIQHWHLRRIDDLAEAAAWATAWAPRWEQGSDASWAITTPRTTGRGQDGEADGGADGGGCVPDPAVGYVALRDIHLGEGSAQVSYWVTPAARGQHLAARAVDAVADWAFTDLGLHRLWITHSTVNAGSCAAAVRAGFVAEGTLRQHLRHTNGWHDMHVHGRIATDP